MRSIAPAVLLSLCLPASALADGQRDLEDGIAFYENLDSDRAMERLTRATRAPDLGAADKAKAYLYLGMLQFEIGGISDAKKSWSEAIKLKRDIKAPEGTSPKTIEAIEEVRAKTPETPGGPKVVAPPPSYDPPPPPDAPDEPPPPAKVAPPPPPVVPPPPPPDEKQLVETTPPAEEGSNTWLWVGIGAGAAVVVAVVIVVVVVTTGGGNGSECDMGGGGCLGVTFQ